MAESHEASFPNTPVVICGSPESLAEASKLDSHFTGVWTAVHPEETLEVALRLLPDTKHVVVVGGVAPYDRYLESVVKNKLSSYESRLDFAYFTEFDMPLLLERLKHLPSHTIVYHTSIMRDAAGNHFIDATQAAPLVAGASIAPGLYSGRRGCGEWNGRRRRIQLCRSRSGSCGNRYEDSQWGEATGYPDNAKCKRLYVRLARTATVWA
jgi:hypothetical protein